MFSNFAIIAIIIVRVSNNNLLYLVVEVNMPADSFESPLTLAACGGHTVLAHLLLERGANIEEVNDEGYTPLMEAAREGHEDMVKLLLKLRIKDKSKLIFFRVCTTNDTFL